MNKIVAVILSYILLLILGIAVIEHFTLPLVTLPILITVLGIGICPWVKKFKEWEFE